MMSLRLRTLCRRMNSLELLKNSYFFILMFVAKYLSHVLIFTRLRVGLLHTPFK